MLKTQSDREKQGTADARAPKRLTILAVGRISQHKGQLWLAQVYLTSSLSISTRLVLAGEIENTGIATRIQQLQVPNYKKITLTGAVSENRLQTLYQKADLFALFPDYEAFGLVFLEALSHHLPVLTHRVGALSEVITTGAVLVDKYNRSQAVDALTRLIEQTPLRRKLAHAGYNYVRENFSWDKTARAFLAIYYQLT